MQYLQEYRLAVVGARGVGKNWFIDQYEDVGRFVDE